jgi:drug/metabolite transporter (DMT)-like permease
MTTIKTFYKPMLKLNLPPLPVVGTLLAVYIIWGSTYFGGAIALESYPPFMLVAIRLLIATIILVTILKLRHASFPPVHQMRNAAVIGGLMFGGGAGLVAFAQQQGVASGLTSLGVAVVPLWATIFASFFGYRPSRLEIVGLVIGMSGVAILNMEHGMQSQPLGATALLIGPTLWAFGSMFSKRLTMPQGLMGTVFQMLGGSMVLIIMSILNKEQFPADPSLRSTVALVLLAIFGTLIAFSAYMYLVRTVRPTLATSYAYVNPVIAVVLGIILLAEQITSVGILAMVVIVTGVVLLMMGKHKRNPDND